MKKILIPIFLSFILLIPSLSFAAVSNPIQVPDCMKWKVELIVPMYVTYVGAALETTNFRYGKYVHPQSKIVCTRFFLKSTGQTLWQEWQDDSGVWHAFITLKNGVRHVAKNARIGWRLLGTAQENEKDTILFEAAVLKLDMLTVIKSRTFIFDAVWVPWPKQVN